MGKRGSDGGGGCKIGPKGNRTCCKQQATSTNTNTNQNSRDKVGKETCEATPKRPPFTPGPGKFEKCELTNENRPPNSNQSQQQRTGKAEKFQSGPSPKRGSAGYSGRQKDGGCELPGGGSSAASGAPNTQSTAKCDAYCDLRGANSSSKLPSEGTQTTEVKNNKTGCDIANYGPLPPSTSRSGNMKRHSYAESWESDGKRNKRIGSSTVRNEETAETCGPAPPPASNDAQTQALEKNHSRPGAGGPSSAHANEYLDTDDLNAPKGASCKVTPGQGHSQGHDSPHTSKLYSRPTPLATSSVEPSVVPTKDNAKTSALSRAAPAAACAVAPKSKEANSKSKSQRNSMTDENPAPPPHLKCCPKGEEGGKDCAICKPFVAGTSPLTIKYKAIIVDAKPTLAKISLRRFPGNHSVTPSVIAPTVAVSDLQRNIEEDTVEQEFQKIVENNVPMVWIFGYTQSSIVKNKYDCVNTIAARNNFVVLNLSEQIERWMDESRGDSSGSKLDSKIRADARKILEKIPAGGGSEEFLVTEDICELLKLCMVGAMNPSLPAHSTAKMVSLPSGFIIDNFPLSAQEGMEAEMLLYKSLVCLYFASVAWSLDKEKKDPPINRPKYHLREDPYSEKRAEGGADYFGFKTIKVINAEDLEETQIADIGTLVSQHLDGNGLQLHKVMRKVLPSGKKVGGHDYKPDGTAVTVIGSQSNIVMDHNNFLDKSDPTASGRTVNSVGANAEAAVVSTNLTRGFTKSVAAAAASRGDSKKTGVGNGKKSKVTSQKTKQSVTFNSRLEMVRSGTLEGSGSYYSGSGSGSLGGATSRYSGDGKGSVKSKGKSN